MGICLTVRITVRIKQSPKYFLTCFSCLKTKRININRNYFPDFLLNNKYLIEIKPKNLFNSIDVIFKKEAAIEYCNNNNLIYKLISPNILSFDIIKQKYLIGEIKFIERYDKKFKEKYL